jgi:hypothetical protein
VARQRVAGELAAVVEGNRSPWPVARRSARASSLPTDGLAHSRAVCRLSKVGRGAGGADDTRLPLARGNRRRSPGRSALALC